MENENDDYREPYFMNKFYFSRDPKIVNKFLQMAEEEDKESTDDSK